MPLRDEVRESVRLRLSVSAADDVEATEGVVLEAGSTADAGARPRRRRPLACIAVRGGEGARGRCRRDVDAQSWRKEALRPLVRVQAEFVTARRPSPRSEGRRGRVDRFRLVFAVRKRRQSPRRLFEPTHNSAIAHQLAALMLSQDWGIDACFGLQLLGVMEGRLGGVDMR